MSNAESVWSRWPGMVAFLAVVLLVFGGILFAGGRKSAADARRAEGTPLQTAGSVRAVPPGGVVLVAGRIAPESSAPARGLAIYLSERYVSESSRDSDGRVRTERTWKEAESFTPPFTLAAPDGPVRIVNDGYAMARPSVDEEGREELGELRFEGFRPGDPALVFGTAAPGGVAAERVFGGTREEFLAWLRENEGFGTRWGGILLGLGLAGLLPLGFALVRERSR